MLKVKGYLKKTKKHVFYRNFFYTPYRLKKNPSFIEDENASDIAQKRNIKCEMISFCKRIFFYHI